MPFCVQHIAEHERQDLAAVLLAHPGILADGACGIDGQFHFRPARSSTIEKHPAGEPLEFEYMFLSAEESCFFHAENEPAASRGSKLIAVGLGTQRAGGK